MTEPRPVTVTRKAKELRKDDVFYDEALGSVLTIRNVVHNTLDSLVLLDCSYLGQVEWGVRLTYAMDRNVEVSP